MVKEILSSVIVAHYAVNYNLYCFSLWWLFLFWKVQLRLT